MYLYIGICTSILTCIHSICESTVLSESSGLALSRQSRVVPCLLPRPRSILPRAGRAEPKRGRMAPAPAYSVDGGFITPLSCKDDPGNPNIKDP